MPGEPFIGRADQLAQLHDWTDEIVSSGSGRFVLITGESGMGKTRLCAEFVRRLSSRPVSVAWSRCWVAAGGPALWPWPDVIGELGGSEAAAPNSMAAESRDRFAMFRRVVEQLRALCAQRPAVAVLDDLHAASSDVTLLTTYVARSLHRFPLLLVVTWRVDHPNRRHSVEQLDALAREASVLELPPFDAGQVARYLRESRGSDVSAAEVQRYVQCTEGNPMYLAELVRHPAPDDAGSDGLALALARRVADQGTDQRRVLGAAALLGTGATVTDTAAILGWPPEQVIDAVRGAGSMASLSGGEIGFSHDLLRAACLAAVPAAERQRLHVAARDAIRGRGADRAVRRAHHAVEAAPLSPEDAAEAVSACIAAAVTLQRSLAFEQAVEWASTACVLAADVAEPGVEARALITHAVTELACGRLAAANELFSKAVRPTEATGDPRLLAEVALGLGGVWVEEQRDELARRRMLGLCRRALAALGPDDQLLAARLSVRIAAEEAYDGLDVDVIAAVDVVRASGDPAATAEALSLLHHTLLVPERAVERLRVADELLDAASAAEATIYSLFGLCWRTVDLYLLGDPRAERAFVELRERATALRCQAVEYIVAVLDVMRTFRRGELERAEGMAGDALTLGLAAGDHDALGYYGGHLLAIRWAQGRLDEMLETIASVIESSTLRRLDHIYPALLAYGTAVRGDHDAARAILDGLLADGVDSIPSFSTWSGTMLVLVETAAELDDAALAAELAARFKPVAHLPVMPSLAVACLGPGQRVVARALATARQLDEAVAWYRAALDANRRLRNRPFGAVIRAELAAVLQRRGAPNDELEAAGLLAAAIGTARALGMAVRVEQWERQAGPPAVETVGMVESVTRQGLLERRDDAWMMGLDGRSAVVDHVVGMSYVAALVARPDTDISAVDLCAAVAGGGPVDIGGRAGSVHDERARADYRRRLAELERELDRADLRGDVERGRRAAEERDRILEQLRRDTGRRGRPRPMSDESERCRMRVSKAIHRAVAHVRKVDQVLGRALESRIRTGFTCRYENDPGEPIVWTVRTHSH